ncbi:MAG: radical SAM protein [Leptospiraceae bacterium]|nr:MAG: radical SAM protein [Leptospiraceae bacterium]
MKIDESIEERLKKALKILNDCEGCYRYCRINRWECSKTYCHTGIRPKLYKTSIENDQFFINNKQIAKIYFQHCNLRCIYCYDYQIHHEHYLNNNNEISLDEYGELLVDFFQNKNIKAIQLINVDHLIPHTLYAIYYAIKKIQKIKKSIIFESNGFALQSTLHFLKDFIQIYITDFKFISEHLSRLYLKEQYYPEIVKETVREMYQQVGDLEIKNGFIQKGLIIRLLILPDLSEEYLKIIDYLKTISLGIGIIINSNYIPSGLVLKKQMYKEINQTVNKNDLDSVYNYALKNNFKNVYFY